MASSEQALLNHVYSLITSKPDELQRANKVQRILKLSSILLIAGAVLLTEFTATPGFLCVLLAAAGGMLFSIPAYIRILLANWPHLAPHIDEKSIKSRLDLIKYRE